MDVLIVVDMQEALLLGDAKHDLALVIGRINRLARCVRERAGRVVLIQHDGPPLARHTPGWEILSSIERDPNDLVLRKSLNDAFFGTSLQTDLTRLGAKRLLVTGWATDLCVDATVRSAAAAGFEVVVVADAHTVSDRPHLCAARVIEHHHWVWENLISRHPVRMVLEADLRG